MRRYLDQLLGNEETKSALGAAIARTTLSHALLIEGDEGSGKRTLAREIASALLCEAKGDEGASLPCRACRACHLVSEGLAPDVHFITRGDKATLGVDAVREMIGDASMASTEFDYKVYVFEDAHTLTVQAQNALLKVMEEPPEGVVILLLTEEADAMLTTVRSRARLVRMQRFTADELRTHLSRIRPDLLSPLASRPEELTALLLSAEGSIGRAIKLLSPESQAALKKERAQVTAVLDALAEKTYAPLYAALSALPQKRDPLSDALALLHTAVRDLILLQRASDPPLAFFPSREAVPEHLTSFRSRALFAFADVLSTATEELARNANVSTTLTALALRLRNAQKER